LVNEFSRRSTSVRHRKKMIAEPTAAKTGDVNQEMTMTVSPLRKGNSSVSTFQMTASRPLKHNAKPMMPPMIECVVDTGHSMYVAKYSQTVAAVSAHSMPYM